MNELISLQITLGKRNYLQVFQSRVSLEKVGSMGREQAQEGLSLELFILIKLPLIYRHGPLA